MRSIYQYTNQQGTIDSLVSALREQGYEVPPTEQVEEVVAPSVPQVRYFNEVDSDEARKVRDIIAEQSPDIAIRVVRFVGEYQNVPPGILEVWLPPS